MNPLEQPHKAHVQAKSQGLFWPGHSIFFILKRFQVIMSNVCKNGDFYRFWLVNQLVAGISRQGALRMTLQKIYELNNKMFNFVLDVAELLMLMCFNSFRL